MKKIFCCQTMLCCVFLLFGRGSGAAGNSFQDSFSPLVSAPSLASSAEPSQVAEILAPPAPLEFEAMNRHNATEGGRRYQIGFARTLPQTLIVDSQNAPVGQWTVHPNGWRGYSVAITSPGAGGLRVHVENISLPAGARILVYQPNGSIGRSHATTLEDLHGERDFWSGTVLSEQAVVECQVPPGKETSQVSFTISEVSHVYDIPIPGGNNLKEGTCHNDVTCYPAYAQEASGVARMSFVQGGNVYLCTGCLLTTSSGSSADYFLTANHCIPSQSLASTIELYWFFQTSNCRGAAPDLTTVPHTAGGAELLATSTANDFTFLKLRQAPPGGTYHLAWSTATPAKGETLTGIHHPNGAYKRICFGKFYDSDANFWAVQWYSGVTEPGSSGSPLLNSSHLVIGQLNGGWNGPGSSCGSPSSPDQYGRFDLTFPKVEKWLGSNPTPGGYTPVSGTYSGLFSGGDAQSTGLIGVTVTTKGTFSGRLQIGTRHYSFKGLLDANGSAEAVIPAGPFGVWSVDIQVDDNNSDHMSGTLNTSSFTTSFDAYRAVYNGKTQMAPQAGQYTLVIPGSHNTSDQPGGDSYGTVRVSTAGKVTVSGSLADGTQFSQSASLSGDGRWPMYVPLYSGQGCLAGWATVSDTVSGTLSWIKPPTTKTKAYTSGFAVQRSLAGSAYTRPYPGGSVLNTDQAAVNISGADLGTTISDAIQIGPSGKVLNLSSDRLSVSFSTSTGTFKGSVLNADTGRSVSFSGVVLQNQGRAVGYFLMDGSSGEVSIDP